MHTIEAIYTQGRIELPSHIKLRRSGIRVKVLIPEEELLEDTVAENCLKQRLAKILGTAAKPRATTTPVADHEELLQALAERSI